MTTNVLDTQPATHWSDSDLVHWRAERKRIEDRAPLLTDIAPLSAATIVGRYLIHRYRRRVAVAGAYAVAWQLRKQGVPLAVARVIILGTP